MDVTKETIWNYRVVRRLGEGGMGTVCLAEHPVIGRKVAIKLLHADLAGHEDIVARFLNEARAIHTIGHENVVEILDFGETDHGQPYFIMEFLGGEPLSDALARGPMDPAQVAIIAGQICRALSAAHSKGIVHRDLKPQNVQLVTKSNGGLQVKVLDFGVAKILESEAPAQLAKTHTGAVLGTPLYMAPEQCRGAGTVDHRADIYALGVVLFEMLTGRPPFVAEGVGELFTMHMFQEPPQLAERCPQVPRHVAAAVMKSLAKDPGGRFQSMDELRDALSGDLELLAERSTGARTIDVHVQGESVSPTLKWKVMALVGALVTAGTGVRYVFPKTQRVVAVAAPMRAPGVVPPAGSRLRSFRHLDRASWESLLQCRAPMARSSGATGRRACRPGIARSESSGSSTRMASRRLHFDRQSTRCRAHFADCGE